MKQQLTFLIATIILLGSCGTQNQIKEEIPVGKITADKRVDVRGKTITTFIIYNTVITLQKMDTGEIIEVVTDNYMPIENDMQAWSRSTGNKIIQIDKTDSYNRYYIQKNTTIPKKTVLAMVISNNGLEELISPLGFALGSALNGNEVNIYFQGPAVKVFKKGYKEKLHGFNTFFSGFAREGLRKAGHIPPQEKIMQLKNLGARFYLCGPSMDHFDVKESELILDEVTIAEYVTFLEIMENASMFMQF